MEIVAQTLYYCFNCATIVADSVIELDEISLPHTHIVWFLRCFSSFLPLLIRIIVCFELSARNKFIIKIDASCCCIDLTVCKYYSYKHRITIWNIAFCIYFKHNSLFLCRGYFKKDLFRGVNCIITFATFDCNGGYTLSLIHI